MLVHQIRFNNKFQPNLYLGGLEDVFQATTTGQSQDSSQESLPREVEVIVVEK
jgi:hypothetical protein